MVGPCRCCPQNGQDGDINQLRVPSDGIMFADLRLYSMICMGPMLKIGPDMGSMLFVMVKRSLLWR